MFSPSLSFLALAAFQLVTAQGQPIGPSPRDSTRLLGSVRSAQSSFEAFRRSHLPRGDLGTGLCDVWVGRYCYWRGDDEEDVDPPAEPESIRQRRASLIHLLDSAATVLPGDPWIGGQVVRYLAEAGRFDDAIDITERCTAERSWCLALGGYAAHVGSQFALADSLFTASLAALSDKERCRWLDISESIDGELAEAFKHVGCDGRQAFVRRVLRIGAPLYSVSATDLFTEHLARVTRARIAEHAASTDGEPWGDDQRELIVRYGWPRWYTLWQPSSTAWMQSLVFGHDGGVPFDFTPSLHAMQHVSEITDDDWHLDDEEARTGYAPLYAKTVHLLPSQLARFRRGDSTLIVAAWDARRDTSMLGRTINAALAVLDDSTVTVVRADSTRTRGHLSLTVRVDSGITSLELLAPRERRAARTRQGIGALHASTRVALSDLLLYAPSDSIPMTLAAAADSALASTEVAGDRPLGIFWEAYGLHAPGEHVRYTLSVQEIDVGWMRRAAARVHLSDPTRELRIQWEDLAAVRAGIAPRAVKIDLSRLRHGRYRVELAVEPDGGAAATTTRVIEVK